MTDEKLFQLRGIWSENNQKLSINVQKQNISDQEAIGLLEMAKDQILTVMRQRMASEFGDVPKKE